MMKSIDPATGETVEEYPKMEADEVDRRLDAAAAAFRGWRDVAIAVRAEPMRRAAALLRERAEPLAALMAREMGKPITGGRAEVDKCAWVCEHYAENAARFLADEEIATDASRSYVCYRPLGPVLAIMPWNYPLWQVFRFAAPALMAGNAGLLKHAPNVTGCAHAIEALLAEAGFPAGLFAALVIDVEQTGAVIDDPRVAAVTLTGSVAAGRAVAARAGEMLKKTVLELGGSDAYVVLEDADASAAAEICVTSRLLNSGQSCIAAKRFIAVDAIRDEFQQRVVDRMGAAVVGDPMDEATEIGPMARLDLRDDLHRQVTESVDAGATLVLGGELPDRAGAWYPPTVLADVAPGMPAYNEELFGPVACILPARDAAEALRIANDTDYGLGAAVLTADPERGRRIAERELDAGCCFVNAIVESDPRLPFGGIKESGYGRELGAHGIREFTNVKTVYVG